MPAYKDEKRGNWYAAFYYENWKGERQKKMKRGFKTRKAAQEWERQFLLQKAADMNMEFERFVELYREDKLNRLKENPSLFQEKEDVRYSDKGCYRMAEYLTCLQR